MKVLYEAPKYAERILTLTERATLFVNQTDDITSGAKLNAEQAELMNGFSEEDLKGLPKPAAAALKTRIKFLKDEDGSFKDSRAAGQIYREAIRADREKAAGIKPRPTPPPRQPARIPTTAVARIALLCDLFRMRVMGSEAWIDASRFGDEEVRRLCEVIDSSDDYHDQHVTVATANAAFKLVYFVLRDPKRRHQRELEQPLATIWEGVKPR